jgi:two-component system chemotaxis response regulator CheB
VPARLSPVPEAAPPGAAGPVVAIATSAGGLRALKVVLAGLPADFPAAVLVVQHLDREHHSYLADILGRHARLRVKQAEAGDPLGPGTVFIAPPDYHLLVNADGTLGLSHSELVRFVRPSADRLFESLADHCQGRAIAVVLTGMGSDGAAGVRAVKRAGGRVLVQDQATAEFGGMPAAAIQTGQADAVLPLDRIAEALISLTGGGGTA